MTMPWDEIDSGKYSEIFSEVSLLIRLRHECQPLKGSAIEFIHHDGKPRVLHYLRSDESLNKKIGVCLNCGNEDFSFTPEGKALFSRLYDGEKIMPNGTVIYEM